MNDSKPIRRIRVEPLWNYRKPDAEPKSQIRLRGHWLKRLFKPNSYVLVDVDEEHMRLIVREA